MPATATASERKLRQTLWRWTLCTHRWVGIAVGIIIFLWCVSGIVMMYVQYPALDTSEQLAALDELDISACCGSTPAAAAHWYVEGDFVVEMDAGRPVLRLLYVSSGYGDFGRHHVIDLSTAQRIGNRSDAELRRIGTHYAAARGWAEPTRSDRIDVDQWTVHARFDPYRPMVRFANAAGNEWYVASTTGEVVQVTSRGERFWNWLGSVPHWLYFTTLRQNTAAWAQTVIWLTLIGLFLTVTGAVIGIKQFRWRSAQRKSPYSNWMLWHHYAGLVFGVFTLTWLISGLISMNPWGTLESRGFAGEHEQLSGVHRRLDDIYPMLQSLAPNLPDGTTRIESAFWLGAPWFIALDRTGKVTRLSPDGVSVDLSVGDVRNAVSKLSLTGSDISRLDSEDHYYFGHHATAELPVYRITTPAEERLYVSARTGRLVRALDENAQSYRWLFSALHRGDFHEIVRRRPVWDVMMLLLLAGVTLGAGTGTWLGIRYLAGRRRNQRRIR